MEAGILHTRVILMYFWFVVEAMDSANLGLKLVASTVTSFLILALLLFMVHRLRQRRLLIMMRRTCQPLLSAECFNTVSKMLL